MWGYVTFISSIAINILVFVYRVMPTQFSQGGLNVYEDGWVGWMGLGGSLLQWHPDLNISFAFVPTFLDWSDLDNARAKTLQVCFLKGWLPLDP